MLANGDIALIVDCGRRRPQTRLQEAPTVHMTFNELQLDALREGPGERGLRERGHRSRQPRPPVDALGAEALALPLPETIETVGGLDEPVTAGGVVPVDGDLGRAVVFGPEDEQTLCPPPRRRARRGARHLALAKVGKASYVNVLG